MVFVAPQVLSRAYYKVNLIHLKSMNGVQIEVIERPKHKRRDCATET
jgi:hypothetical protein